MPIIASLRQHLARQYDFLRRSAASYDAGIHDEAVRIAVVLRVLFHDTKRSKSLLGQLGVKRRVKVLTTIENAFVRIAGTNRYRVCFMPLMSPECGFIAPLDKAQRNEFVSVDRWWTQAVVWRGDPHTRQDMVLTAANKDGGAHVDAEPDVRLEQLRTGLGSYRPAGAVQDIPLENVHFSLLRQFAYEVMSSPDVWASSVGSATS